MKLLIDNVHNSYSMENSKERNSDSSEGKSYQEDDQVLQSHMSDSVDFRRYENQQEHGLVERIYDKGQGEKFNDLIKNPTKIQAMKAFITADDEDVLVSPNEPTPKQKWHEKTSQNVQDLLSITGFKVIDKLPPTGGETYTNANIMIDRFRASAAQSMFSDTKGNMSKTSATRLMSLLNH